MSNTNDEPSERWYRPFSDVITDGTIVMRIVSSDVAIGDREGRYVAELLNAASATGEIEPLYRDH